MAEIVQEESSMSPWMRYGTAAMSFVIALLLRFVPNSTDRPHAWWPWFLMGVGWLTFIPRRKEEKYLLWIRKPRTIFSMTLSVVVLYSLWRVF